MYLYSKIIPLFFYVTIIAIIAGSILLGFVQSSEEKTMCQRFGSNWRFQAIDRRHGLLGCINKENGEIKYL
jgi:hypothetical protein